MILSSGQSFEPNEREILLKRIKVFIKDGKPLNNSYIMLRNGRTLGFFDYSKMVNDGKINPQDVYAHVETIWNQSKITFYYPFLDWYSNSLQTYLSKLGFDYGTFIVPASGLKYIAFAVRYKHYLTIELANLDTVVDNTNLRKIVVEVVGEKLISGERKLTADEYNKIFETFKSQKLFAGYNFSEAVDIIYKYYYGGDKSLVKVAARIAMDYDRIFQPHKVCYDIKTWDEVGCWSIELRE